MLYFLLILNSNDFFTIQSLKWRRLPCLSSNQYYRLCDFSIPHLVSFQGLKLQCGIAYCASWYAKFPFEFLKCDLGYALLRDYNVRTDRLSSAIFNVAINVWLWPRYAEKFAVYLRAGFEKWSILSLFDIGCYIAQNALKREKPLDYL